jgi:cytochrome P450
MKHLLDNTPRDSSGLTLLYGESRLIVGAGSETTSTALTLIFIQLALHPQYMHAVRQEYRENEKEYSCLRPTPLLAAVIHESMRIWPSVFFASQRVTPPEGMTINGHYIPGNMIIAVPTFVLHCC